MTKPNMTLVFTLVLIITVSFTCLVLNEDLIPDVYAGSLPPPDDNINGTQYIDGDWVINSPESYTNETIILTGNLNIQSGSSLIFYNVTLIMNNTFNGEFEIEVLSGGLFKIFDLDNSSSTVLDGSNITSADPNYHYLIRVRDGSSFIMNNSELHECGWDTVNAGLTIESENNIIYSNNISYNYQGITCTQSSDNIIMNNNISNNFFGIYLISASKNNKMIKNSLFNNFGGIYISMFSSNNIVTNNTIFDNDNGILIVNSPYIIFKNNTFLNDGIGIFGNSMTHFTHNLDTTNRINNKSIYYFLNETGVNIDSWEIGQLILINCTQFIVQNVNISNTDYGILSAFSENNTFIFNKISFNTQYGIIMYFSSNNIITYNNIYQNIGEGIRLRDSHNINITYNHIFQNDHEGINLYRSEDIYIYKNNITENNVTGIKISDSTHSTISTNQILSNIGEGLTLSSSNENNISENNISFSDNYGITLTFSSNNNFYKNIISSNIGDGIYLFSSTSNKFIDNNISSNSNNGIYFRELSDDNILDRNIIYDNLWGCYFDSSSNNIFRRGRIYDNSIGVNLYDNSINNEFTNCSINNTNTEFKFHLYSQAITLNTTFNKLKVIFNDVYSNLTVQWFLHVRVIEPDNDPIQNVSLYVNDTFGNSLDGSPYITKSDGYEKWIIIIDYIQNQTDKIDSNPHNITAIMGNHKKYAYPDPIIDISKLIIIEMDPFNPTADAGPDVIINEDEQHTFDASGSFDNVGIINYTWNFGDGNFGYGTNPTHTYYFEDIFTVTLNVSDAEGNWAKDIINMTVNNVLPVAKAGTNISVDEGQNIIFDGSYSYDTPSDNSSLLFTWFFGDGNYSEGMSVNYNYEDNGTYIVTLHVIDDDGSSSFDFITVIVNNTAPVIIGVPPQNLQEDNVFNLQIVAMDVLEDSLTFWDNTTLFDINSTTGIISFIPSNDDVGVHYIKIFVTDDDGGESNITIRLDIQNTNDAPSIISTPLYIATQDIIYYYNVSATDDDMDELSYDLDSGPEGMVIDTHGNITWIPVNDQVGPHSIVVNVSDPFSSYVIQEFSIIVLNSNDAPFLETIGSLEVLEGETFSFAVMAVDVDVGDILTFSDNTDLFEIDSSTGNITFIPGNDDVGVYTISISAVDSNGAVDFEIILFRVINVNNPPDITQIESQVLTEDIPYNMMVVANDMDIGDSLTFLDNSTLFNIDPITGIISFIPTNDDVGIYLINISVNDENNSFAYQTITFEILNVNDPPSIEYIGELRAEADKRFSYRVIATDIDQRDTLLFSDDTELFEIDPNTGEISFTPSAENVGVHRITITVIDSNGETDIMNITITIKENDNRFELNIWILLIMAILCVFFLGYLIIRKGKVASINNKENIIQSTDKLTDNKDKP